VLREKDATKEHDAVFADDCANDFGSGREGRGKDERQRDV
jgi:hypothetical protein